MKKTEIDNASFSNAKLFLASGKAAFRETIRESKFNTEVFLHVFWIFSSPHHSSRMSFVRYKSLDPPLYKVATVLDLDLQNESHNAPTTVHTFKFSATCQQTQPVREKSTADIIHSQNPCIPYNQYSRRFLPHDVKMVKFGDNFSACRLS